LLVVLSLLSVAILAQFLLLFVNLAQLYLIFVSPEFKGSPGLYFR